MKKAFVLLLALCVLTASASAETVTAMATEPYMETYASYACYARLREYDAGTNTLAAELIIPEIFRGDDVEGLAPGDGIFTGGREVPVLSVSREDGTVVLNGDAGDAEETVRLERDARGSYRTVVGNDFRWTEMARVELPVTDRLLFLDRIDPATGESLDKPSVHGAEEFLLRKAGEEDGSLPGPGFDKNNVLIVFDGDGRLAVVVRYAAP